MLALSAQAAWAKECSNITKDEVIVTQKAWGDGIVAIGKANDPKAAALNHLNTLYGYDMGKVLLNRPKRQKISSEARKMKRFLTL